MSWADIKKGASVMSKRADELRTNAMAKVDGRQAHGNGAASPGQVTTVRDQTHFDELLSTAETEFVVLDVFATWCPPCKALAPGYERLSSVWGNVTFLRVDGDAAQPVAQALGVTSYPTIIFFSNGAEIDRLQGATERSVQVKLEQLVGSPQARSHAVAGHSTPPARAMPPPRGGTAAAAHTNGSRASPSSSGNGTGVFVNMTEEDKEAFFALLDEYFESRPHLLAGGATSSFSSADPVAAAAAKHGPALASAALRNPGLTSAAMKSRGVSPGIADAVSNAAATAAAKKPPVAPPAPAAPAASAARTKHAPPAGLTTGKSIGSMNTASSKAAFGSILNNAGKKAPPPDTSFSSTAATTARAPAPPPPRAAASPPRVHGIGTVTALYDYAGTEDEDLTFSEGDVITLTERVSDDWWKGELRGREGIFPSSYVQES